MPATPAKAASRPAGKPAAAAPRPAKAAAAPRAAPGPKTALVTGATSGIGHAVATGLARHGLHVTLLVRDEARGKAAQQRIAAAVPGAQTSLLVGDLASQASVRAAASEFRKRAGRLDVLVHCAGVFLPTRQVTPEGVEATLATNYLGPFLLTHELLPLLRGSAPARIVSVASRYGGAKIDFDDLNMEKRKFSYLKAVPPTKLAQVLFTQELAERLSGTGITVNAIHPGLVKNTNLLNQTGGFFRVLTNLLGGSAEKGADSAVWLATADETANVTGGLWSKRKLLKTPGQGSDPAARQHLWEESEKLVGNASSLAEHQKPAAKTAKATAVAR